MSDSDTFDFNNLQKELNSPEKLHSFATHYNWDDGLLVPRWIINNLICDRGTALMIYWRAAPMYYCKYANRNEVTDMAWDIVNYDLIIEIEEKYLKGFYKQCAILFNPRYDMTKGMVGYDWTQKYNDKPQLRKIPLEMFEPSIQDAKWEALGKPIIPIKRVNFDEVIKSINNQKRSLKDSKNNNENRA